VAGSDVRVVQHGQLLEEERGLEVVDGADGQRRAVPGVRRL
jgi:hypothetical protein